MRFWRRLYARLCWAGDVRESAVCGKSDPVEDGILVLPADRWPGRKAPTSGMKELIDDPKGNCGGDGGGDSEYHEHEGQRGGFGLFRHGVIQLKAFAGGLSLRVMRRPAK